VLEEEDGGCGVEVLDWIEGGNLAVHLVAGSLCWEKKQSLARGRWRI
jgi:hypothetical protein